MKSIRRKNIQKKFNNGCDNEKRIEGIGRM